MKTKRKCSRRRDFLRIVFGAVGAALPLPARWLPRRRPTARPTMRSVRRATRKPISLKAYSASIVILLEDCGRADQENTTQHSRSPSRCLRRRLCWGSRRSRSPHFPCADPACRLGFLAALARCPGRQRRKAQACGDRAAHVGCDIRKSVCTHCSDRMHVMLNCLTCVWIGAGPGVWDCDQPRVALSPRRICRELVPINRRLRYPMKLVNGQWTRVSWDPAINEIGDKLHRFLEFMQRFRHLARIGQDTNEGATLFRKFRRVLGHHNTDHQRVSAIRPPSTGVANTLGYGGR